MLSDKVSPIVNKVKQYLQANCPEILSSGQPLEVGVALSGGADSVAALLIGRELGWKVSALHCNFHLRGPESNRDQAFCENLCRLLNLAIQVADFDVETLRRLPEHKGKSTEMICRDLRYEWFGKQSVRFVATGHHLEDNVETAMLNSLRRCGLRGVKGMLPVAGSVIRPLLCLTKAEILAVVGDAETGFVEDSTNSESLFLRNRLRNLILPALDDSFPGAAAALGETVEYLRDDWQLFEALIEQKRRLYTDAANGDINIEEMLRREPHPRTLLFHILDGKLDRKNIDILFDNISNSGKSYRLSDGRVYVLNRHRLHPSAAVHPLKEFEISPARIWQQFATTGLRTFIFTQEDDFNLCTITVRIIARDEFRPCLDRNFAWFSERLREVETLQFTHVRTADRIRPFGMQGTKLVSDLFTDAKFARQHKEEMLALRGQEGILWLPGLKHTALYPVTDCDNYIFEFNAATSKKNS